MDFLTKTNKQKPVLTQNCALDHYIDKLTQQALTYKSLSDQGDERAKIEYLIIRCQIEICELLKANPINSAGIEQLNKLINVLEEEKRKLQIDLLYQVLANMPAEEKHAAMLKTVNTEPKKSA